MRGINKLIKKIGKSEGGFVFLVALMAMAIMVAIGFFSLTTISEDTMVSFRFTGERKAFSAAESCAYFSFANVPYNTLNPTGNITDSLWSNSIQVDPTNDSTTTCRYNVYWVSRQQVGGFDFKYTFDSNLYRTAINGTDSLYGSSVSIETGVSSTPTLVEDTRYEAGGG